jgi:hypothetical protein
MWPGNGQGRLQIGSQTDGLLLKTAINPGLVLVKQFSKSVLYRRTFTAAKMRSVIKRIEFHTRRLGEAIEL